MAYIELTKGGSDSRVKSTISCWVKRCLLGSEQYIWGWGEANNSDAYLRFDTGDNIECNIDGAGSNFNSTRLFRDTNAWYHFVVSLDGSNATANLRRRIWVNGEQLDDGNSAISTFSSAVMGHLSTQDLWIGSNPRSQNGSNISAFDGYISHFHYCDGYSYAASDFGETDSVTGEWKIKTAPSVNYGASGFFLKMENGSNMDQDSSGNNKTLVTNGTINLSQDNPSNVFCTLNPLQEPGPGQAVEYSFGNTKFAGNWSHWQRCYGSLGANTGKFYYEFKCLNDDGTAGHLRVGWDSIDNINNSTSNTSYYSGLTLDREGKLRGGESGHGEYSPDAVQMSAAHSGGNFSFTANDILGMAIDIDNQTISVYKNGNLEINAQSYASYSNCSLLKAKGHFIAPSVNFYSTSGNANRSCFNFGNGYFETTAVSSAGTNASNIGIFEYNVPTGYTAFCTKGINSF